MALQSAILAGPPANPRLESAASGGPAIKGLPAVEDAEAVGRIQKALVALGFPLPGSVRAGRPDGRFGPETLQGVKAFQKVAFPADSTQWDGQVGRLTLAEMDRRLPAAAARDGGPFGGPLKPLDILVRILGLNLAKPGAREPNDVSVPPVFVPGENKLSSEINTPAYTSQHYPITLGTWWAGEGKASPVDAIVKLIQDQRNPDGRVFLIGISRGGWNAMEVGRRLASLQGGMRVRYLALVDPAFNTEAEFKASLGDTALYRENYYQSLSDFAHQQFHGPLTVGGFNNFPLNNEPALRTLVQQHNSLFNWDKQQDYLDKLHLAAIQIGYGRAMAWVKAHLPESICVKSP
jgi:peptidoglycan hydrolase-like protein with peptidoglycan-binding domain